MVDKVLELLPLYLALSTQTEGARRLLVMVSWLPLDVIQSRRQTDSKGSLFSNLCQMYMFRDQVLAFEQRKEYILRISDLEKLRVQLQRCWTFVSQTASGAIASPLPGQNATLAPAGNAVGAGIENTNFQGVVMRTGGLKMEDLKQPPLARPKRQASSLTESWSSPSAIAGPGAGAGTSYASPIQLDSPSPEKQAGGNLPTAAGKKKAGQTPDSTASAPTPKPTTTGGAGSASAKQGKGKPRGVVNAKTPLGNEITYEDAAPPPPAKQQAADNGTPASGSSMQLPSGAAAAGASSRQQQQQQQAQVMQAHAHMGLKRKRELEEAHNDPAAFSERIFADFVAPALGQASTSAPGAAAGIGLSAVVSGTAPAEGLGGGLDWMSFLTEDALDGNATPPAAKKKLEARAGAGAGADALLASVQQGNNALGLKWYSDTPSFPSSAETPELDASDAQRTSPAGTADDVFTPADSQNQKAGLTPASWSPKRPAVDASPAAAAAAVKTGTSSIMASFDREYERLFASIPGSALLPPPPTGSAQLNGFGELAWSWDAGLLPATGAVLPSVVPTTLPA